jgi:NADH:ubiquinone oxidoreductase subunit F (NADH-binding)/(2Fe-2S) ferredoxin/Pyruvate/2-oxoacid:ferredoxin oxidoreductase delta subunit
MKTPSESAVSLHPQLEALKKAGMELLYPPVPRITVGTAACGLASGAGEVLSAIQTAVKKHNLNAAVTAVGCVGFCQEEPLVDVLLPGRPHVFYRHMDPKKAAALISELSEGHLPTDNALCQFPANGHSPLVDLGIPSHSEIPFFAHQVRTVLKNCGFINPDSLEEYVAVGGYTALWKVLTSMTPEQVISEVKQSGLRGRGGAGFPTGRKWESCRKAHSPDGIRYVICNADEGDPGAYMDRGLLESNPFSVIEGMTIGAYAVGASQGYIYIRHEYPEARKHVENAVAKARSAGLLGSNILGTGFSFDIEISQGGGAFVCGESTALVASIEGRRGEPRDKQHLRTVQSGLFGRPTVLNNVETWANVPLIIANGPDWFASLGTQTSKGTKVFSLVGQVQNTGLVEVPMGMSLRQIIFNIGGGIPNGRSFKAVQTGGPSGGCIPEHLLDLPVDFEALSSAGSMMGSGGMIVMDENTCMVDVARYFTAFLMEESCGKCLPCREGVKRMNQILTDISEGRAKESDLALLEELACVIQDASLCGLGKTAPNPVLSTIRHFRHEYTAHILDRKCPAGVCRALVTYSISPDLCKGCGACVSACPVGAITGERKSPHSISQELCIKCGSCLDVCPTKAVVRV